jgi:hypothetical protein
VENQLLYITAKNANSGIMILVKTFIIAMIVVFVALAKD